MSRTSFQQLAAVKLTHAFGDLHPIVSVRIQPTTDCTHLLANYRLIFRQRPDGLVLYQEHDGSGNSIVAHPGGERLDFALSIDPGPFHILTDTSALDGVSGCFHLHNGAGHPPLAGGIPLTAAADATWSAADLVTLVPTRLPLTWSATTPPRLLEILDEAGTAVYRRGLFPPNSPNRELVTLPRGGRYSQRRDGTTSALFADDQLVRHPPTAILTLRVDWPAAERTITTPAGPIPRTYLVHFPSRQTVWRYLVVPQKTSLTAAELSVSGFPAGRDETLADGQPVVVFEAPATRPFRRQPGGSHQLTNSVTGVTLVPKLPYPRLDSLNRESPGGTTYSDMFVYL